MARKSTSRLTAVEQDLIDQYRQLNDITQDVLRHFVTALPAFELILSNEGADEFESARQRRLPAELNRKDSGPTLQT